MRQLFYFSAFVVLLLHNVSALAIKSRGETLHVRAVVDRMDLNHANRNNSATEVKFSTCSVTCPINFATCTCNTDSTAPGEGSCPPCATPEPCSTCETCEACPDCPTNQPCTTDLPVTCPECETCQTCATCATCELCTTPVPETTLPPAECETCPPSSADFGCLYIAENRAITSSHQFSSTDLSNFFDACIAGDVTTVTSIVESSPGIISMGNSGQSSIPCLSYASGHNNQAVFEYLMTKQANVNILDAYDDSAIHWAAHYGHNDRVETLLANGAHINAIDMIELLANGGCRTTSGSHTPLDWAIFYGMERTADLLVSNGGRCFCYLTPGCEKYESNDGLGYAKCPPDVAILVVTKHR